MIRALPGLCISEVKHIAPRGILMTYSTLTIIRMAGVSAGFVSGNMLKLQRADNVLVCHSEREVFEAVDLSYLEPWERD